MKVLPTTVDKKVIKKTSLAPTVLIAGGAGFIGSNLAETLLLKDARVIVLDNFKTGKKEYLEHLLKDPKFALFDVDISAGLPAEIGSVDYIFHLAGLESYIYSKAEVDLDTLLTNALGTKNLLDLANSSPAKFLLASSLDVYRGAMSPVNLDEYFGQSSEEEKRYSLNEAKRFAEALVWEYFKKNGTDVRIARLPEVYGPKMNLEASGNLGSLLQNVSENKDLVIHGDGFEKDYYLYVTDAVSSIVKALFNKDTAGKIFSLVPKEPYSVLETAYLLRGVADRELNIVFKENPKTYGFFELKTPDTQTLGSLKWEPKVPLKEGVVKTLAWLGYKVNEHSFKPAKFIEEKKKENVSTDLTTLAGIKEAQPTQFPPESTFVSAPETHKIKPTSNAGFEVIPIKQTQLTSIRTKVKKFGIGLFSVLVSFILIFGFMPLLLTYFNVKSAVANLEKIPSFMGQLDSTSSKNISNNAFQSFNMARDSFGRTKWLFALLGKSKEFNSVNSLITSAQYFSKSAYNISKAANPLDKIWEVLKPTSQNTLDVEAFNQSKVNIDTARYNLQLAEGEFKNVTAKYFSSAVKAKIDQYSKVLTDADNALLLADSAVTATPELIGLDKPRKYLILFQNSNEIRPTGGFIGSYALLEIDKGKITNLSIDDIYNPDGQIVLRDIKVTSPKPISDLLNEKNLTLHNSNWSPDFPTSAVTFEDLYYRVTGVRVDGVLAVDLTFVKNLLAVTGPVFLTAYNEEINAQNLYERTQFHSDFNYKNGSDQKRSFLTVLGSKLLEKLFALPKEKMPDFFNGIQKALNERHLMFYISNNTFATILNERGWDGSLVKTDTDYLYVVNANLGGTKANYFVQNTMNYEIFSATRDGVLRGQLTLEYKHTGKDNAWPGGPYTDYVRVLTQAGSKLTGAKFIYPDSTEKDVFKDMVISKEGIYNSFETSFVLNPDSSVKLVVFYDLPQKLNISKDNMSYELYWQKQPGTTFDPVNFVFNSPFGLNVSGTLPKMTLSENVVKTTTDLTTDRQMSVLLR